MSEQQYPAQCIVGESVSVSPEITTPDVFVVCVEAICPPDQPTADGECCTSPSVWRVLDFDGSVYFVSPSSFIPYYYGAVNPIPKKCGDLDPLEQFIDGSFALPVSWGYVLDLVAPIETPGLYRVICATHVYPVSESKPIQYEDLKTAVSRRKEILLHGRQAALNAYKRKNGKSTLLT